MDLDFPDRLVVTRDPFADNNNIKVVTCKTSDMVDDLEDGELSENDPAADMKARVVTRPDMPDLLKDVKRVVGEVDKRNPWGGVAESWAAGISKGCLETEWVARDLEMKRVSVKDRLGWGRREDDERGDKMDWRIKMKRPRMEMVADMEEKRLAVKNRLYEVRLAKREMFDVSLAKKDFSKRKVTNSQLIRSCEAENGREAPNMKIEWPGSKDIVRRVNDVGGDESEGMDPLSDRFKGTLERRPRFRGRLERTVEFGALGGKKGMVKSKFTVSAKEKEMSFDLQKDNEDSLEKDNGSDLDDLSMLVQVTQSCVESSDEESKKIREAVIKIEAAKKREEMRRRNFQMIDKEERDGRKKNGIDKKKREDIHKEQMKEEKKNMEMRVRKKIRALNATEKKLLMEKSRQLRIRNETNHKKSAKDSQGNEGSKKELKRKSPKEETDSDDDSSSTESNSSSSDTNDDSSSESSDSEDIKSRKKFKRSSNTSKLKLKKQEKEELVKGKIDLVAAAVASKKETIKVRPAQETSREDRKKVSDLKSKLKNYLNKAKEKKMT